MRLTTVTRRSVQQDPGVLFLVLPLNTQYFSKFCEQNHRHIIRVKFEPTTCEILEQCLTCSVAGGSLNPMF